MLDLGAYLLGILALALLATSAWLGGTAVRRRLLPEFDGAPAHLATSVLALALLIWVAELLGTVGLFEPLPYLAAVAVDRRLHVEAPAAGGGAATTGRAEASTSGR